ncbi:hypothetical protein [Virgibacillus halodenitrificans]|uniref:hypothetical protein n=1 Tax=Virgibacillus halodenitrificans TaxID=1482 RepID=UPI002DBA3ADB|nr:hypothetical protein [Virgibacillus halodenitrificans]MEC2158005.1 hypothetical protein [Virgibacillus halodenitrificans]
MFEKIKKLDFEYKIVLMGVPLILILSIIFTFFDNKIAKMIGVVVNSEWTGFWGSIAGGIIGGFITLLSVKMTLNHASQIHKQTLRKMDEHKMEEEESENEIKKNYIRSASQIIEHIYEFLYLEPNRWLGFINGIIKNIDLQISKEIEPEELEALINFMQGKRTELVIELRDRLNIVERYTPAWSKVCREYSIEAIDKLEDLYESLFMRYDEGELITYKYIYDEFRNVASYIHYEIYEDKFKVVFERILNIDLSDYHVDSNV